MSNDVMDADEGLIETELAREKLRTEVEFVRRELASPRPGWDHADMIAWAAEKLGEALKIQPDYRKR